MAKVNTISKQTADEIAASYLKTESVHSLYVTRDGQVFYADKQNYMRMHERANNLEKSWFYPEAKMEVVEAKVEPKTDTDDSEPMSFASLKEHFQKLTDEGKIKEAEWKGLKFAQLRKEYEKQNK